MAVNFEERIHYISSQHDITYLQPLPDKCPVCHVSISPQYFFTYTKSSIVTELLCGCPRNDCGSLFFAVYKDYDALNDYRLVKCYPSNRENRTFPNEIIGLSPDFVEIYNQAHHAEQEELDLICGVGYRKALEYLIKDFVIYFNPDETEKIKRMPLQQCIQHYINQPDIKEMAERAVWLGNDETHYVRKWEDKDIQDLKNLIDLTVYFISMTLKAKKYKKEMVR